MLSVNPRDEAAGFCSTRAQWVIWLVVFYSVRETIESYFVKFATRLWCSVRLSCRHSSRTLNVQARRCGVACTIPLRAFCTRVSGRGWHRSRARLNGARICAVQEGCANFNEQVLRGITKKRSSWQLLIRAGSNPSRLDDKTGAKSRKVHPSWQDSVVGCFSLPLSVDEEYRTTKMAHAGCGRNVKQKNKQPVKTRGQFAVEAHHRKVHSVVCM